MKTKVNASVDAEITNQLKSRWIKQKKLTMLVFDADFFPIIQYAGNRL